MFSLLALSLDHWGAIWAIVAGVVAAVLFVGGVGKWTWDRWRRPELVIECGNTKEFDRRMVKTGTPFTDLAEGRTVLAAHAKFLRVDETRGIVARDVRAWITAIDPANPEEVSAVKLRWWDGSHSTDIVPNGHDYLFLHHIFITEEGNQSTTPTCFEHQSPIKIEITLYVGDRKHSTTLLEIEHAWPGIALILGMQRSSEADPIKIPEPFPYPWVRKLGQRRSDWWRRVVA